MIDKLVRDLRIRKGISSKDLSNMLGMNNTWVSQIETGKIKHPQISAFKKMLKMLDVTDEDIEKIIVNEFSDVEKPSKSRSPNKTDYQIERKRILTKAKPYKVETVKVEEKSKLLTAEKLNEKCMKDADYLFNKISKLPKLTIEILINRLLEEL